MSTDLDSVPQNTKQKANDTAAGKRPLSRRTLVGAAVSATALVGGAAAARALGSRASAGKAASDGFATTTGELTRAQKKLLAEFKATYDVESQAKIKSALDDEYAKAPHGEDNPFAKVDPFGTNTLSCYVRFSTKDAVTLSYTVKAGGSAKASEDTGIADFTRTPKGGDAYATEHEFLVFGLIPGCKNDVRLTLTGKDGAVRTVRLSSCANALKGTEKAQLTVSSGSSKTELADGLYAILGNDSSQLDFMYLYDNDGYIRGEIPLIGYRSHRLLFDGAGVYFSVSTTKIAQVNALGQVTRVFNTGDFELHHDYVFDGAGDLLVLASDKGSETDLDVDRASAKTTETRKSVEDKVIKIDTKTGEVSLVVDLGDMFPDLKAQAKIASDGDLDWIHINTIQWLGNDTILLSSRETSTVIKLRDIYGTPTVDWLMGDPAFWKGSGFEDKLLTKQGAFDSNAGQHSATYLPFEGSNADGYRILMFDNNYGVAESYPKFDWSQLGAHVVTDYGSGTYSLTRLFTVDEDKRTYAVEEQFKVPFSAYVSSAQQVGSAGNVLVDSGQAKTFTEYDRYGRAVRTFKMPAEKYIYRVYKYDI